MVPTTPEYFYFLVAVFFAYWLLRPGRLAVVCLANYFFYAQWGWIYLALVPAASTCDFFIGRALGSTQGRGRRRQLVAASLAINIGLIVTCKYVPLFFHGGWVLPLGLSFYAFQALTYTLDIYRKDAKPCTDYLAYLASVSFFPTTLAGPITRVATLVPQWAKRAPEDGGKALFLIGLGLVKKFLIADYLAQNLINRVFDLPTLYSGGDVLVAVYGYAFQLYYDFSGYTDIAIGSALLLGIKLPVNFNRPYAAESIADFWRRWHISLSNWLRDYLYFSLPGKRTKFMPFVNLVITMGIGGLWHGANWTFLIWGLLHGFGLAAFRWWNPKPSTVLWVRLLRGVVTFHFVLFGWIFFRAASLEKAVEILQQIGSLKYSFENTSAPFLMVLGIGIAAHYTPKDWYERVARLFAQSPAYVQAGALALLTLSIQYVGSTGAAPFVYTKY